MIDCQNERVIYHGQPTHFAEVPMTMADPENRANVESAIAMVLLDLAYNTIIELNEINHMLARRCADQAKQIADLVSPPPAPTGDVFSAIATHERKRR